MSKLPVDFATWGDKLLADFADRNKVLDEKLRIAVEALKDIHDNFDCDKDAHRYDTGCRACMSGEALTKIRGEK